MTHSPIFLILIFLVLNLIFFYFISLPVFNSLFWWNFVVKKFLYYVQNYNAVKQENKITVIFFIGHTMWHAKFPQPAVETVPGLEAESVNLWSKITIILFLKYVTQEYPFYLKYKILK